MRQHGVFFVLLMLMTVLPASAFSSYEVAPWGGAVPDSAGVVPVPLAWWEVPIPVLLLFFLLPILPASFFGLFWMLKVCVSLGFKQVHRGALLANRTRRQVYDHIRAHPGIGFAVLSRDLGVNRGTIRYHLAVLEQFGAITIWKNGRSVGYFENSGKYSESERRALAGLSEAEREICTILAISPGSTRSEVAASLGVAGSTVSWHVGRLARRGVVAVKKEGREVRYDLCPPASLAVRE
ncbi:winged helix-turn-helix transcriptional regulator [Methanofollis aquaemaris]|uniref:Winged helix-turn-helix transcriptional regulator n=1 Tax=Methanofollis aquaemaris TaxID=126734 RepID=A0A8A3S649_9EURY|nr:helix-turn-helix domain-containing protein [Methanofollis aquaemaris]QSZ67628.1 winged helix-turn-helix transcriptional regulator [Methanofollis aquaemaris]